MPSPFPGMDPYLEPHWPDVHGALIGETRRVLNRMLPPGLAARMEERVVIESLDGEFGQAIPDVRVFAPASADPDDATADVLIEAPYKLVVELDPVIERYIRIIDNAGELVSVIEFLSPGNKRPPGLTDFREKRRQLLQADVHVVEIDLVRKGDWRSLLRPEIAPAAAANSSYRATVRTAGRRPAAYFFPISLRDALPEIPVPLRRHEAPVKLPLQRMLDAVYEDGRYATTLDYSRPLDPPLDSDDAAWVERLIRP